MRGKNRCVFACTLCKYFARIHKKLVTLVPSGEGGGGW